MKPTKKQLKVLLRRGYVDGGRIRWVLHGVDMEPWRDQVCGWCGEGFDREPTCFDVYHTPMHVECEQACDDFGVWEHKAKKALEANESLEELAQ